MMAEWHSFVIRFVLSMVYSAICTCLNLKRNDIVYHFLQDGFVLVGSVAGQRYWSSMLNLDSIITCGIWTPDDQQVYFGTAHGQIIVMDVHGAMVSQVQLFAEMKITSMAWSCEKFKMEEGKYFNKFI